MVDRGGLTGDLSPSGKTVKSGVHSFVRLQSIGISEYFHVRLHNEHVILVGTWYLESALTVHNC
jgi:hypothetical protein